MNAEYLEGKVVTVVKYYSFIDKTISKGNNAFIICINTKSTVIKGKKEKYHRC